MPIFTINQRGTIRGIPRTGPKRHFLPGDTYTPVNNAELAILRQRPDYVATEERTSGEGNEEEPAFVPVSESAEPVSTEPTELEIAQEKRAFKDDLATTPQPKLWEREFPDGSKYKSVWKHGMKKVEFVKKILEKLDA